MDPDVPEKELKQPSVDSTDFSLLSSAESSASDTPENMSATGDFALSPPIPPWAPFPTLTAGGNPIGEGPPPIDSLRLAVPGYEIISELGRGGMGVVYLARQIGLNRAVALKMILSGEHAGVAERDRFRREAEAVATLQHPNIVQIYDVGESHGRPYLAFEYVSGGSLAAVLAGQPWPAKPAADLVEALARAMQYAHERGVIHRDLKPANILLQNSESGSRSGEKVDDPLFRLPNSASRVPKITDFGLAKRFDPESVASDDSERTAPIAHTRTGAVVGTPSYLAPEQAAGKNRTVGPHTDVYSLGAILYELLTGRPPFRGETALDTVLQVMSDDPVPPSKLRAKMPRDLETICLKCLQKEGGRRYSSAGALADDLQRFQRGEAIAARPVGRWERAVKWMKRHPAGTVMGITSAIAVASLLVVSLYFNVELGLAKEQIEDEAKGARNAEARALRAMRTADEERIKAETLRTAADRARQEAEAKKREADRGVYALQLFKAAALGERDPQRALRLLDDRNRCPEDLRDFTWRYIRGQNLVTEQLIGDYAKTDVIPPVARVSHSPDGKLVATVSGIEPLIRIFDLSTRRLLFMLAGHQLAAHGIAWSPDGKTLASTGGDNTVRIWALPAKRPATTTTLSPKATLPGHSNTVNAVVFSPDGHRLATAGADGLVRLWDVPNNGMPPTAAGVLKEHSGTVWAVAWSDAGLFSAGSDGRVLMWRLSPGGGKAEELFKLKRQVLALAASPDGELIAAAGDAEADEDEPVIELFRPLTDKRAGTLRGHTGLAVYDLAFAPDGKRLASAGRDGTVRLWDVSALQERAVFRPEKPVRGSTADSTSRAVRGVSFGTDGLSLVSGGQDGGLRLWNFTGQKDEVIELEARAPLAAAALSADGQTLAVAEKTARLIKIWRLGDPSSKMELKPTRVLSGLDRAPLAVAVNADGSIVAAATADGVYLWRGGERPIQISRLPAAAVAIRGDDLAFATTEGQLHWLDAKTGKPKHSLLKAIGKASLIAFSPDGKKLVTAGGTALQIWDADSGEMLFGQLVAFHYRTITAITIRPGDTSEHWEMATADEGGLVFVWDLRTKLLPAGEQPASSALEITTRRGQAGLNDAVTTLAFTTDGRTLASGSLDRNVRLRDPETGQERAALAGHTDVVLLIAFRADRVMLSVGREGVVRMWRASN